MTTINYNRIQGRLLALAQDYFALGFPRYSPQREKIIDALRKLTAVGRIRSVLFPANPFRREEVRPLEPKVKNKEISLEELQKRGVIPSYDLIKPSGDDNGGDDSHDVYLHASLYVLPAPPSFAKNAVSHPEEYKNIRPYITESNLCTLPSGAPGYFVKVNAIGFGGAMVVNPQWADEKVVHFHLEQKCTDNQNEEYETDNVYHFDGFKIYQPIWIEKDGKEVEYTLVLSATISIFGGLTAFGLATMSDASQEEAYGLGSASEILMVLKRLGLAPPID